jgi:hypothetical protein
MRSILLLSLVAVVACSNKDNGSDASTDSPAGNDTGTGGMDAGDSGSSCNLTAAATVTGMLLNTTLAAKDAVYVPPAGSGSGYLAITDFTGTCAVVKQNANKKNSNVLVFVFTGPAAATGMRSVGPMLDVQYAQYDAMCSSAMGESATSGSITITKADMCGLVGTYDVTLGNDHVTGTFTAPTCAAGEPDGGTACQ